MANHIGVIAKIWTKCGSGVRTSSRVIVGDMTKPAPKPEGELLQRLIKASRRSQRGVAKSIGLSDTRLRQILQGVQPAGGGQFIEVTAPADTLARIAAEVGATPEELDEVGRADVAQEMRRTEKAASMHRHPARSGIALAAKSLEDWMRQGHYLGTDPPSDGLRIFTDEQIVEEVGRRFTDWRDRHYALIKVKGGTGSDSGQDEAQKMKRSMQAADDGQPPATVHDMRDASEGTVGTHALPPNWEQALAADQQDDEPVGERLRREQDEAAERGHDEGGDQ